MSSFDTLHNNYEHNFIKYNAGFLKAMFGTADVTPFWIADMDFKVAPAITEALQKIVDREIYAYEFPTHKVFAAISDWFLKRHALQLDKKAFIQVTGVLTGIAVLIRELTNEGDGIMIQTPVYHQFANIIKTSNRKVVNNPLKIVNGKYQMDFKDVEEKIKSEHVKIILLCNPHNPVGRVWSKEELQKLVALANEYNVTIISDEIHADIVFDAATFTSIASLDQAKHITIIGSPAKTFGMQGIANGYLYIKNEEVHQKIKKAVTSLYLDHGNALSAYATIAAYTNGQEWLDELLVYLQKTIDWIHDFLQTELPQIQLFTPEGTYQIWLDVSGLNLSEEALKELFFHKAKLAFTPGSWFDANHSQYMRMNIASPLSVIKDAFQQLKTVID
ncbi:MalY/PatB family protein [uncultured Kordia sp.]|uniref:MalY/PatB family protein n=1 Tax=uncultured Kordia sp. TaxID=507699 RepID=UPI00262837ED|nr:PatB family C-S lyase [uncultured Kordia sp.]